MFLKMNIVVMKFLVCFIIFSSVNSDSIIEKVNRVKRSDIDLQTCIENFNVHRDKIIRTQDSQNMGAKYLNEIDLGTREECLRLCCETENCDVFVFEEKNSGSCYLFHCGPPDYFKCKFTHHVNYSSGVLAVTRQMPDLESQIKLTKHEQDLSKLRKPETDPALSRPAVSDVKTTFATTTTTMASKEIVPEVKNKVSTDAGKCRRFQFECRSTGECIAIYNVCDGVPQCADGSDEAVELRCPDTLTTGLPTQPVHANSQPVPARFEPNIQQPPPLLHPNTPQVYPQPQLPRESPQLSPLFPHADDFLRPVGDPRALNSRLYDAQSIYHDPQPMFHDNQLQPYVPMQQVQANWVQPQAGQQVPQYADKNSHIFNHKESGFQVPDGQDMRYNKYKGAMQYLHHTLGYSRGQGQMQYADPMGGRNYPKMNGYYDVNYRQPVQQENWPLDENTYENQQKYMPPDNIQDHKKPQEYVPQQQQPQQQQQQQQPQQQQQQSKPKPEPVNQGNPPHVQEKLAHDLKHSKDNMEHGNVSPQKIKIEQHPHHEQYPDVVSYRIVDNDLQDGINQTPRGAILSVTLGLIITAIMAIMIGCRLKMVRRRLRKGGKPYAHDADFLVNGMYL